jgi:hypothetical protein
MGFVYRVVLYGSVKVVSVTHECLKRGRKQETPRRNDAEGTFQRVLKDPLHTATSTILFEQVV